VEGEVGEARRRIGREVARESASPGTRLAAFFACRAAAVAYRASRSA